MLMSKVPIFWAISIISSLSEPISGRNTGKETTELVTFMLSMVWLATCPRLSPVISAPHFFSFAKRSAMRIIKRRIIVIMYSLGQCSCMAYWISVNGTT